MPLGIFWCLFSWIRGTVHFLFLIAFGIWVFRIISVELSSEYCCFVCVCVCMFRVSGAGVYDADHEQ